MIVSRLNSVVQRMRTAYNLEFSGELGNLLPFFSFDCLGISQ
jgi:hypothetical protein